MYSNDVHSFVHKKNEMTILFLFDIPFSQCSCLPFYITIDCCVLLANVIAFPLYFYFMYIVFEDYIDFIKKIIELKISLVNFVKSCFNLIFFQLCSCRLREIKLGINTLKKLILFLNYFSNNLHPKILTKINCQINFKKSNKYFWQFLQEIVNLTQLKSLTDLKNERGFFQYLSKAL